MDTQTFKETRIFKDTQMLKDTRLFKDIGLEDIDSLLNCLGAYARTYKKGEADLRRRPSGHCHGPCPVRQSAHRANRRLGQSKYFRICRARTGLCRILCLRPKRNDDG